MDMRMLMLQLLDGQKEFFANGFATLGAVQDKAEKVVNDVVNQAGWVPAVGKGALKDWYSLVRKSRDDMKKAIDDGYAQARSCVGAALE